MEKTILFKGSMVSAILAGIKTQTRRVIKPQPPNGLVWSGWLMSTTGSSKDIGKACWNNDLNNSGVSTENHRVKPRYKVGDVLYVREPWWGFGYFKKTGNLTETGKPEKKFIMVDDPGNVIFVAHCSNKPFEVPGVADHGHNLSLGWHKRPSIFMPKWASRIKLRVTAVRVERVHDISEEDAIAEGVKKNWNGDDCPPEYVNYMDNDDGFSVLSAKESFQSLWDSINAGRGYPWEANDWVFVYSFERII